MSDAGNGRSLTDRLWPWLTLLLLAGFTVWTYAELRLAQSAAWQDTSGYLAHALYIAERGGLMGFLRESFAGTFPITERHPLYMLMLAPFASRTEDFFWIAKVVSLVTSMAVLVSLVWMVSRRYGRWPALLAGVCYAISKSLIVQASHVDNEPQFVLCALWAWWFLTEPSRNDTSAREAHDNFPAAPLAMPRSVWRWVIGGALVGLAYMAKSPAILLFIGVLVAGLFQQRLRFIASARLWAFVAAAALFCSPLLVRNIIGFGTPFYEGMNSSITWLDDWSDTGGDTSIMFYDRYGVMTIEKNGMPTMHDYLRTHGMGDIAVRLGKGVVTELTKVAPQALGFAVPPSHRASLAFGFLLIGLALFGLWLRRRSWDALLVFVWSGGFIVFFGWDHMFPEIRYLAPLVPIWIAFAMYSTWWLVRRFLTARLAEPLAAAGAAGLILVGCATAIASGALTSKQKVLDVSPAYARLNAWLDRVIEPGDRIMVGPTREFHGMIWVMQRPVSVVLTPQASDLETFLRYLQERKVRYLVMHAENHEGEGGRLKDALAPYFRVTPAGAIESLQPLPGYTVTHVDDGTPSRYIVLQSNAFAASGNPAAVTRVE